MKSFGNHTNTVTCLVSSLLEAISSATRVTAKCCHIRALGLAKITIRPGTRAMIVATDLESETISLFDIQSSSTTAFSFVVNPHTLARLLDTFSGDQSVTLAALTNGEGSDGDVGVSCGPFSVVMKDAVGFDVEDFPSITYEEVTRSCEVDTAEFVRALRGCLPSISNEPTRYYLNGACMEADGGALCITATDGHVLTRIWVSSDVSALGGERSIVPTKAVKELVAGLDPKKLPRIVVGFNSKCIFVSGVSRQYAVISKIIDGTYPNVERVIPQINRTSGCTVRIALADVLPVARRAIAMREHGGKPPSLKIGFGRKGLSIEVKTLNGSKIEDTIPCDIEFGSTNSAVGVNPKLFAQQVSSFGGGDVSMQFSDPGSPLLLTPCEKGRRQLAVLMPTRI